MLYVCTGNICRSPLAERLTAALLASLPGPAATEIQVRSAGIRGWAGSPMDPGSSRALAARGIDPAGFRARQLSEDLVASADLVLGLAREHRAAAVTLHPPAGRRSFTVREFGRLTEGVAPATAGGPAARGHALVAAALRRRGVLLPVPAADDDVADPLGESDAAFAACADQLDAALRGWVTLLGM